MLKVELSYNPYLQETKVLFNEKKPRINSPIEKNMDKKLQEWVKDLPGILRDEMNGYDFTLYFSGTLHDFEAVKCAFKNAKVDDNKVVFKHDSILNDQNDKIDKIDELLNWLDENENRNFDYNKFKIENKRNIEKNFSCILLNNKQNKTIKISKQIVNTIKIDDIKELNIKEVFEKPIIVFINDDSFIEVRNNIENLISNEEIDAKQLFFLINKEIDKVYVQRVLEDLGVKSPQIIYDIDDKLLALYFMKFQMTTYINTIVKIINKNIDEIYEKLDIENKERKKINGKIEKQIKKIDSEIVKLKFIDEKFKEKNYSMIEKKFTEYVTDLADNIKGWNKWKNCVYTDDDAQRNAKEYDALIKKWCKNIIEKIDADINKSIANINQITEEWYLEVDFDKEYNPTSGYMKQRESYEIPTNCECMLTLKNEVEVDPSDHDFFSFIKNLPNNKNELLKTTRYMFEKWRVEAWTIIEKFINKFIENEEKYLEEYYEWILNEYHKHILLGMAKKTTNINDLKAQLLKKEEILQNDNNWFNNFKEKLCTIERG